MTLDSQYSIQDDIDNNQEYDEKEGKPKVLEPKLKIKNRTKTFDEGLQELFSSIRACMTSRFRISIEKMSS